MLKNPKQKIVKHKLINLDKRRESCSVHMVACEADPPWCMTRTPFIPDGGLFVGWIVVDFSICTMRSHINGGMTNEEGRVHVKQVRTVVHIRVTGLVGILHVLFY